MSNDPIQEFTALVERNLAKNGFPEKRVAFPLERMYEEADRRGFSFNKVRDLLRERGIETELTDERVVFSTRPTMSPDVFAAAQEMLNKMTPEQMARVQEMISNMDPATQEAMRRQWEAMSDEEKAAVIRQQGG